MGGGGVLPILAGARLPLLRAFGRGDRPRLSQPRPQADREHPARRRDPDADDRSRRRQPVPSPDVVGTGPRCLLAGRALRRRLGTTAGPASVPGGLADALLGQREQPATDVDQLQPHHPGLELPADRGQAALRDLLRAGRCGARLLGRLWWPSARLLSSRPVLRGDRPVCRAGLGAARDGGDAPAIGVGARSRRDRRRLRRGRAAGAPGRLLLAGLLEPALFRHGTLLGRADPELSALSRLRGLAGAVPGPGPGRERARAGSGWLAVGQHRRCERAAADPGCRGAGRPPAGADDGPTIASGEQALPAQDREQRFPSRADPGLPQAGREAMDTARSPLRPASPPGRGCRR